MSVMALHHQVSALSPAGIAPAASLHSSGTSTCRATSSTVISVTIHHLVLEPALALGVLVQFHRSHDDGANVEKLE